MGNPIFKGVQPVSSMWLDEDTFIVWFGSFKSGAAKNVMFAEVHVDEGDKVVIGVNIYEVPDLYYICTYYYDVEHHVIKNEDGIVLDVPYDMDDDTAKHIKEYALEQMKLNQ